MKRAAIYGAGMWVAGTLAIRFSGHALLRPETPGRTAAIYVASFLLMGWAMPRICAGMRLEPEKWFEATALVMLPTLVLDSWACLFFSRVYPNLEAGAAGVFGGWMLVFCAGAVAGVWWKRRSRRLG
jgi:Family of unknown function (DUF5367)